jgi:hypothetical protein
MLIKWRSGPQPGVSGPEPPFAAQFSHWREIPGGVAVSRIQDRSIIDLRSAIVA